MQPQQRMQDTQFKSKPLPGKASVNKDRYIIRDDGVVFGFNRKMLEGPRFRLYTGDLPCTTEDGLKWLYGDDGQENFEEPEGPEFDVMTAGKAELVRYAKSKFNKDIDRRRSVESIRQELSVLLEPHDADDLTVTNR